MVIDIIATKQPYSFSYIFEPNRQGEVAEGVILMQSPWKKTYWDYEYKEVCLTAHSIFYNC
jgi:hypothetical protein